MSSSGARAMPRRASKSAGVAAPSNTARWEGKTAVRQAGEKKYLWLRQLMDAQKDLADPTAFLESVKVDLFGDEVYVFTPQGDVKALRKGACPIDFAYSIHTGVGDHLQKALHRCGGATMTRQAIHCQYGNGGHHQGEPDYIEYQRANHHENTRTGKVDIKQIKGGRTDHHTKPDRDSTVGRPSMGQPA